ncbi:BsuBI/PstI family type II restriction endonuclease [Citrobacter sedlakii]|uniref:BsuBI/PstI family type II restriction endonuclease n=1 Tax=Citrobacter sedlakii TaxID=67826 RepID=UPI00287CE679|nr:restriction endonuclease [Salmonella enterica]HDX5344095.1 restriction endonuclease [Citrobacter sedlakii]
MNLPVIPPLSLIQERLPLIFPEGTENRGYLIREIAAKTIFVMFYAGAVDGLERWIRPSQVVSMGDSQAALIDDASREYWVKAAFSKKKIRPIDAWYAENTREPIRDETIKNGLIPCNAIIERKGIPTTSSQPRYCLNKSFAALFDTALDGEDLTRAINNWQDNHLNKAALARLRLLKSGAAIADDDVVVTFPNGEKRTLAPGPSSVIAKAVIEVFAPNFLKAPAVLWLSESGNKVVARDEELAQALGLKIDASKALPDIILVDLGDDRTGADMLVVFTEVVATDGPINRERKVTLTRLAIDAGFSEKNLAFLTAFIDRSAASFRKAIPELAWGSYAWFASEPEHLIDLKDGVPVKINQG